MTDSRHLTLVGAGLAGPLLATLLARSGWTVDLFERRGDPRVHGYAGGRSINLALAERGLDALRTAGVDADVLKQAVMMRGRMVHFADGREQLQRYGRDDSEVIWSISRGDLNIVLLNAAEAAGVRLHFDRRLERVDFDAGIAHFVGEREDIAHRFHALIGCDGAGSSLRAAMQQATDLGERIEIMPHGYKELEIPPGFDGGFRMEPNALHIWPRGDYMSIALPNDERTFTVTLFLPNTGPTSFETIRSGLDAQALYARDFADALPLIPNLVHDYEANPTGMLATLYLDRWHLDGRAVLLGDAAHAMVPFHGQGMNCAFEDCVALASHLARAPDGAEPDTATAFAAFEAERKPNAAAIQQMALENYREMSDRVDDADFLLQRALERKLAERHPGVFVPRYAMVSFMRIPYATAFERGRIQRALLVEATAGRDSLDDVDWGVLDAEVRARLTPLDAG
ncbi:NAD(P)/FAD-dependent oxidoreductase [Lysobacter hankyongensis]|uniref:Kynurenine 3-monooxygenase n=1 Tax=Lysobacter hankyongensis TaxID=1176535 RepID=A0ABP9BR31_9GAMM